MGQGRYLDGREVEPPVHYQSVLDTWSEPFRPITEASEFHLSLLQTSIRRAAYVYGKCRYILSAYLEGEES